MDKATRIQILGETVCISPGPDTPGNDVNSIVLPPALGKYLASILIWQLV